MSLPPFAPYPPTKFQRELEPKEWETCLDAWLSLSEVYLRLDAQAFENAATAKQSSLVSFLTSYYHETASEQQHVSSKKPKEHTLKKSCFVLTHRAILGISHPPPALLQWGFLADFSHAYTKTQSLHILLQTLWQKKGAQLEASLQDLVSTLLKHLESSKPDTAYEHLKQVAPLIHASPNVGRFFMTGSDFMDAMSAAYVESSTAVRELLVTIAYMGISGVMKGDKPNYSLIFDHLYSLRTQAEKNKKLSLLADLVTNTPLLSRLRTSVKGKDADRAVNLAAALDKYRTPALARPGRPARRPTDKGKGKATSNTYADELDITRMSLISQIRDIFPDLGTAFIARLLDSYDNNVEEITAHLLEDNLPSDLASLDRTADLPPPTQSSSQAEHNRIEALAPRSTPPPTRRNIFDNDSFDRLEISPSNLHIGRKNATLTADAVLNDRSSAPPKSAILSALAAFDSDDDERDDTYDEVDVGGYVDTARPDGEDKRDIDVGSSKNNDNTNNEEILFRAWQTNRSVFDRTAEVKRSQGRQSLRTETGMTDEGIEGWGIMFSRDIRQQRRLESKFLTFHGGQHEVGRTRYREGDNDNDTEDSDAGGGGGGPSRGGRGRGSRGGGRGGRGGGAGRGSAAAGAPGERSTQIARQRKDARGSSRREGRAKKMARAGFPG